MQECKEKFKRKLKEWPFYNQMFSSIVGNSFVQTLIFILIGIIILFFAKGDNKEIINTVGVTIITASLFKFLLSANAFTNIISNVIKESFFDMTFIKEYKSSKLFFILDNVSSEILERNYNDIKEPLKNEIKSILGEQNGYYKSLELEYNDTINSNGHTETTIKTSITNFSRFEETYKARMTLDAIQTLNADEHFKIEYIKINNEKLPNINVENKEVMRNGTKLIEFSYEFPLNQGYSDIEIKSKSIDRATEHTFFMKKTSSNVKVIYKFDDNIIEPSIISKYGSIELKNSRFTNNVLEESYGNRPFFKSEFLFIKYKKKEK